MKVLTAILVLGLVASSQAAGARSLQSEDLLADAKQIIGGAVSKVESGLSDILGSLFGSSNSWATQVPHNVQDLSWESLQNLDFSSPVKDFMTSIKDKSLAKDVIVAEHKVTELINQFCKPAKYTPSKKVPSNCVGKQLAIRLAPWECSLYDNKTLSCTPPYIEVIKTPATCTAKHNTSATLTGKVCKLEKTIGQALNKTIGGDAFSIDISKNLLSIPHQLSTSLLPGKFDSETAFAAAGAVSVSASKANGISTSASGSISKAGR